MPPSANFSAEGASAVLGFVPTLFLTHVVDSIRGVRKLDLTDTMGDRGTVHFGGSDNVTSAMTHLLDPFRFVVIALSGWMNGRQLLLIDYLREENRVLREPVGREAIALLGRVRHYRHARDSAGMAVVRKSLFRGCESSL